MSWIAYGPECEFPIQNLPYGVFHVRGETEKAARPGVGASSFISERAPLDPPPLLDELNGDETRFIIIHLYCAFSSDWRSSVGSQGGAGGWSLCWHRRDRQ